MEVLKHLKVWALPTPTGRNNWDYHQASYNVTADGKLQVREEGQLVGLFTPPWALEIER